MKKALLFLSLITASLVYGMEERINPIQQNPLLLFPKERNAARDRAGALAMALHPRLGYNSPAHILSQQLVKEISTFARNAIVNEWLKQNQDEIEKWQNRSQEKKDEDLLVACINLERSRILLYAGANPNTADKYGDTPLRKAAYHWKETSLVQILLAAGANPNIARLSGFTPLHEAVRWADKDIVQILLAAGANPNIADCRNGATPLHVAGYGGRKDVVEILLAAGADPTIRITGKRQYHGRTAAEVARGEHWYDVANFIEKWKSGPASKFECKLL